MKIGCALWFVYLYYIDDFSLRIKNFKAKLFTHILMIFMTYMNFRLTWHLYLLIWEYLLILEHFINLFMWLLSMCYFITILPDFLLIHVWAENSMVNYLMNSCIIISPVSEGSGDVMVLRRSRPLPAARNGVNAITQKPRDGLFSNLVYTLVVIVSWPDKLFKVVGQRSRSQPQKMMWFFRHFYNFHFLSHFPPKLSWGGHSNTPQQ